jgi:large subunit ribosomal protein L29
MKIQDLRAKTEKELKAEIGLLKKEHMDLRFRKAIGEVKNISPFRKLKRNVARLKTVLNEKMKEQA